MNPEIKYWLEDNKDKLYVGGAALAVVAVSVGSYFLLNKNKNYQLGEGVDVKMADYILTENEDGNLETINVDKNKKVQEYDLKDNAISFRGENLDELFVYQEGFVHDVLVDKNGQLSLSNGLEIQDIDDEVLSVTTGGGNFGFVTPEELIVTDREGSQLLVFEDIDTEVFLLTETGVYLSEGTEIHYVDFEKEETKYIDIGDTTTKMSQHGETVVVRNNFGSGENIESVLNIDDGDLYISDLKRMPYEDKIDVLVPKNEQQLVYIQSNKDGDEIKNQNLTTVPVSLKADDDEDMDLTDFTIPMDSSEEFGKEKSLAVRGFLYDWTSSGIRVIEMRNGREASRLSASSRQSQIYVPIFID